MKIVQQDFPNFMLDGVPLNTRFNPTTNGQIHVGHLYLVLLNEQYAQRTGGKFQVRFDDNMAVWIARLGEDGLDRYAEQARYDLVWCGVQVDEWCSQRALEGEVEARLRHLGHAPVRFSHPHHSLYCATGFTFPYAPYETLEKVILDAYTSCNCIIRADDLISEFSLYYYFCQLFNLAHPDMVYVPRMREDAGEQIGGGISKTQGNYAIADYRAAGWLPAEVRELAAEGALIEMGAGWTFENLRERPRVSYRAEDRERWRRDHEA